MPDYKLTRSQDWQHVRAPDWQRGFSGSLLYVQVVDGYSGPTWPHSAPDLSGFAYPTGILSGYYAGDSYSINPSGFIDRVGGPLTISGGRITSSVAWCDGIPANPKVWSFGAPAEYVMGGSSASRGMGVKAKVCCRISGVVAYYHTRSWPVAYVYTNGIAIPSDTYLATIPADSATFVTIALGSSLELIAPLADDTIEGCSVCIFWPGKVLEDFPTPEPLSSGNDGLSTDDLPLSTA